MSRHTSPNKRRIDDAYPVRIKVKVPPNGLGNLAGELAAWIRENLPDDRCKQQSTRGIYYNATAFYFRNLVDAQSLLDAFPVLELADGVTFANDRLP